MHSPPINVLVRGRCVDLPIYVEKDIYDLEICLLKHIYREQLVFHNRGNKAMKVQMMLPFEVRKFISLNPSFGYIQAHSPLKIWLKLTIKPNFFVMCKKYQHKATEGEYNIPLKLVGSDRKITSPDIIRKVAGGVHPQGQNHHQHYQAQTRIR